MFSSLAFLHILALGVALAQEQCHDYVLMSARGTSEPQGPSHGFPGMINTTLSTLPNGIEYDVVYPAATNLSANLGADDIVKYLNNSISSCPDQKYAILGYSQGAAAAILALTGYTNPDSVTYQAIKAVVVIGNPGHVPNISGNVDQFGGDTTQNYTGAFSFNGALAFPKIYYTEGKILDICWQGDPICAAGYEPSSFSNHVLYGPDKHVQQMGADFMISKLSGSTNGSTSATPSSSTGSNPTSSASPSSTPNVAPSMTLNQFLAVMAGIAIIAVHSI